MINIKAELKQDILRILRERYSLEPDRMEITYTPDISMGDLALAFPLQMARALKRPPREIAHEIAPLLEGLAGVARSEIAGPGYINLSLDRERFFADKLKAAGISTLTPEVPKIIVEHTSINPNKAAHIGHLRNSVLGDTLVRCLRHKGENIEIQNYIDDTGVQVADVVFGFQEMEQKSLDEIKAIPGKFDYYCWDLYTQVTRFLEENPEAQRRKAEILKKIEEGEGIEAEIGAHVSRRILKAHLETMRRLDITYDLQACESSIIALKFWDKAFALLRQKGGLYFVEEGENSGCWVMKLEEGPEQEKIIVRSNGIVTYTGKDIAYQLWKFGLLDEDFYYEPFVEQGARTIWITTGRPTDHSSPEFGRGNMVYNVIDSRQSYPQKIVTQGLKSLKYLEEAENSIHFSYEMVALSPESLKELGLVLSEEDRDKDFHEVSGRKGVGVKADDLLDRLEHKAMAEVELRNPGFPADLKADIAHKIAVGSLRYFMLKYARNSLIVFDFADVLSFEGETGPYLQYTLVRINSIFRKMAEVDGFDEGAIQDWTAGGTVPLDMLDEAEAADFWEIVLYAAQADEEVLHSLRSLEFLHLAKYTFNLCQKFNAYYHKYTILNEQDAALKQIRTLTIYYIRETLKTALSLMGIPQPERM
jgi:arginyl-tRNA synthetase